LLAVYRFIISGYFSPGRIYYGLDTHMDGLVLGSALSYLFILFPQMKLKDYYFKILSRVVTPIFVILAMTMIHLYTWKDSFIIQYGFTFSAVVAATMILDLTISPYSLFKKVFELRPLVYIGKISYGLYLYHFPIYYFVRREYDYLDKPIKLLVMVSASFLIAALSYHLYEKHFLKFKKIA